MDYSNWNDTCLSKGRNCFFLFLPTKSNEKNDLLLKMSKSTDGYVYDSTDKFISQQGTSKQEKNKKEYSSFLFPSMY